MSKIKLEDVGYFYKNTNAAVLKHVSCSFEEGTFYCIIGPSGCGKSTLLSLMGGLDSPKEGSIYIGDSSLADRNLDCYRRQEVSMIFQMYNLFPLLTVLENVSYPMEVDGVKADCARKRAEELLEAVKIEKEKHGRYPSQISGGEQQRVAIARALSTEAKVILADEPTGNLDMDNSDVILKILLDLAHEEGYCVIVVTHDERVTEVADVIYTISNGTIEVKR